MPPNTVTISANIAGNYVLEDDGIFGNNFSQVRYPDGMPINFEHPTNDLIFAPIVIGTSLTINLTDPLGTGRLTAGDLVDPSLNPQAIVVRQVTANAELILAATQAIPEFGSGAAPDIVAATLVMSAGSGIGEGANPLDTQVNTLEAETTTGRITLRNFGTVAIGGLSDAVGGLGRAGLLQQHLPGAFRDDPVVDRKISGRP
jgi:hypothetical protein